MREKTLEMGEREGGEGMLSIHSCYGLLPSTFLVSFWAFAIILGMGKKRFKNDEC